MKIEHLLEFVEEDFKSMSQKATNIAAGKGAVDNTQLRQQRIAQLSANQKARNAFPAGRPMAPAGQQPAAPAQPPAQPPAAPAQQAAPTQAAAPQQQQAAPQGSSTWDKIKKGAGMAKDIAAGAIRGVGDIAGATAGAVTNVAGSAAGGAKRGYRQELYRSKHSPQDPAPLPQQSSSPSSGGGADLASIASRLSNIEQKLGIAETKFYSRFLDKEI